MNDLVEKLSRGDYSVELVVRPEITVASVRECVDRGFVHVRFTGTRGGTELGVLLDRRECELRTNEQGGIGHLRIVGTLTLNYEKVRCIAEFDMATFAGLGHLEPVAAE